MYKVMTHDIFDMKISSCVCMCVFYPIEVLYLILFYGSFTRGEVRFKTSLSLCPTQDIDRQQMWVKR